MPLGGSICKRNKAEYVIGKVTYIIEFTDHYNRYGRSSLSLIFVIKIKMAPAITITFREGSNKIASCGKCGLKLAKKAAAGELYMACGAGELVGSR